MTRVTRGICDDNTHDITDKRLHCLSLLPNVCSGVRQGGEGGILGLNFPPAPAPSHGDIRELSQTWDSGHRVRRDHCDQEFRSGGDHSRVSVSCQEKGNLFTFNVCFPFRVVTSYYPIFPCIM